MMNHKVRPLVRPPVDPRVAESQQPSARVVAAIALAGWLLVIAALAIFVWLTR